MHVQVCNLRFTCLFPCKISGLYVKVTFTCETIISHVELEHFTCEKSLIQHVELEDFRCENDNLTCKISYVDLT